MNAYHARRRTAPSSKPFVRVDDAIAFADLPRTVFDEEALLKSWHWALVKIANKGARRCPCLVVLSEDALSEATMAAWKAIHTWDGSNGASVKTWALSKAAFAVKDWVRVNASSVGASGISTASRRGTLAPRWLQPPGNVTAFHDDGEANLSEPGARDDIFDRIEGREEAAVILGRLRKRDADFLRLRFGLDGKGDRTHKEVGRRLGLSKSRCCQIEARILRGD